MRNLSFGILILDLVIILSSACIPSLDLGDLDVKPGEVTRKTLIPSSRKCASKATTSNKITPGLYCYHDGVCQFKIVNINETHYTKSYYCLCQSGFVGDECREDETYLLNMPQEQSRFIYNKQTMLNFVLFTILVLITLSFICYLISFYQKSNPNQIKNSRSSSNNESTSNDDSSNQMLTV